jgi:SAM-dependent methyltransferase
MVEAGRVRLPHVEWKTEDAWQPNSRGVDWIFSSSLLQWAVDPVDVLSRWRQQLRPGGRLLSSMYVEGSLAEWEDLMPGFSSLPFLSEEDWRRAFREARFRIEREETTIHILMYPSAKDALKSIHAVGAVEGRRLSPSTLRRLLAEADTRYPNEFPMTWRALRIECSV